MTFEEFPVGERFRWEIPPLWNGDLLDGIYVKGSPETFGESEDWQPLIVTHEAGWEVIAAPVPGPGMV